MSLHRHCLFPSLRIFPVTVSHPPLCLSPATLSPSLRLNPATMSQSFTTFLPCHCLSPSLRLSTATISHPANMSLSSQHDYPLALRLTPVTVFLLH
jgi:hypothetical protein